MTEHNLFTEIQEDLQRQQMEALWKRYGTWVVAAAFGIVLVTAGMTAYHTWKMNRAQQLTAELISVTKPSSDDVKNIEEIRAFASKPESAGTSLSVIALLRAGALAANLNDTAKAVQIFDQVANDTKADPAYRQLGDLYAVQVQMDSGDAAALSQRLVPLTEEHAPWRYSALEAQGYLAIRVGDKAKAKQIFTDLSQDARAPHSIGARATDVLRSLN